MGSLLCKKKKQQKQQQIPEEASQSFSQQQQPPKNVTLQPKMIGQYLKREKAELTFKDIWEEKKKTIENSPIIHQLLNSQEWIIENSKELHFKKFNALQYVQQSPALALHITTSYQSLSMICNPQQVKKTRDQYEQREHEWTECKIQVIYADLFSIQFSNLKKLKLKPTIKSINPDSILSLEPLCKLTSPFLQQLNADDHPITNIKFLRRCLWPFLSKLSFRNNAIVDSAEIGSVIAALSNVAHLQGLDLKGMYSSSWSQISWILKIGFKDAAFEQEMLQSDPEYNARYNGKVFRRIDCDLHERKMNKKCIRMIYRKFNNNYLENPLAIW